MAITSLGTNDTGSTSRTVINDNFTDLDTTKADLASPALTGNPTAPTQSAGDNSTKIATTAYVDTKGYTSTSGVSAGPASSTTQTVTHNLGRTPTTIRVTAYSDHANSANSSVYTSSTGAYNSSGNSCIFIHQTTSGAVSPSSSTAYAIKLGLALANTDATGVIQNVTSTSFDIVWTASGNCSVCKFIWEAQ